MNAWIDLTYSINLALPWLFSFLVFVVSVDPPPQVFPLDCVNNLGSGWSEKRKGGLERMDVKE